MSRLTGLAPPPVNLSLAPLPFVHHRNRLKAAISSVCSRRAAQLECSTTQPPSHAEPEAEHSSHRTRPACMRHDCENAFLRPPGFKNTAHGRDMGRASQACPNMIETCAREQLQFSFIPGRGGARVFLYSIAQTVAHLLILRLTFYILYHSLLFSLVVRLRLTSPRAPSPTLQWQTLDPAPTVTEWPRHSP